MELMVKDLLPKCHLLHQFIDFWFLSVAFLNEMISV